MELPHPCQAAHQRTTPLLMSSSLKIRIPQPYYPAQFQLLLYIHPMRSLCPSKPALQPTTAPCNANETPTHIMSISPSYIDDRWRNQSIRFVSDQGNDHRIKVEEEHYEVET